MGKYLIVDDNDSIAKMLVEIIEIEGHEAVKTNDGRNALTLIDSQKFDAVLLDIAMPEFSGIDVIDKLEKSDKLKETKIIILTASTLPDTKIDEMKERGVFSVLRKPVDMDVLMNLLNS